MFGVRLACREGGFQGSGSEGLLGQPGHQLHERGRYGFRQGHNVRGRQGRLPCLAQGRSSREYAPGVQGPRARPQARRVADIPASPDVRRHGRHALGLAPARVP